MNPHIQNPQIPPNPQNPQNFQHQQPQNTNSVRPPPKKLHEKYVHEILNFICEKTAQIPNQIQIPPDVEEEIRVKESEFLTLLLTTTNRCYNYDSNSSDAITEEHVNRALAILSFPQTKKNDMILQTTNNYSNSPSQTHQNRLYIANLAKEELNTQDQN